MGPRIFKLLRNFITSAKPGEKLYTELVEVLIDHFNPKQSEIHALAKHCNFAGTLDVMIRNRLVCGKNDIIQKRLLKEGDKNFVDKAISHLKCDGLQYNISKIPKIPLGEIFL